MHLKILIINILFCFLTGVSVTWFFLLWTHHTCFMILNPVNHLFLIFVSVVYLYATLSLCTTTWCLQMSALLKGNTSQNNFHWLVDEVIVTFSILSLNISCCRVWWKLGLICLFFLPFPTNPPKKSYVDPGPHGNGRYIENMLPEVEKKDFRKGSQV